jgi:hypothetical protein
MDCKTGAGSKAKSRPRPALLVTATEFWLGGTWFLRAACEYGGGAAEQ